MMLSLISFQLSVQRLRSNPCGWSAQLWVIVHTVVHMHATRHSYGWLCSHSCDATGRCTIHRSCPATGQTPPSAFCWPPLPLDSRALYLMAHRIPNAQRTNTCGMPATLCFHDQLPSALPGTVNADEGTINCDMETLVTMSIEQNAHQLRRQA